jgi:hypothetical protein
MTMAEKEAQAINATDTDSSRPLCSRPPFSPMKVMVYALYMVSRSCIRGHIFWDRGVSFNVVAICYYVGGYTYRHVACMA